MSKSPLIVDMRETKFNNNPHFKTLSEEDLFAEEAEPLNSILSKFKYWFVFDMVSLNFPLLIVYRCLFMFFFLLVSPAFLSAHRPRNGNKVYSKRSMFFCGFILFNIGFLSSFLVFEKLNLSFANYHILNNGQICCVEDVLATFKKSQINYKP